MPQSSDVMYLIEELNECGFQDSKIISVSYLGKFKTQHFLKSGQTRILNFPEGTQ